MSTEFGRRGVIAALIAGTVGLASRSGAAASRSGDRATGDRVPGDRATGDPPSRSSTAASVQERDPTAIGDAWPAHRYDGGNTGVAADLGVGDALTETWSVETDDSPSPPVRAGGGLFYTTDGGEVVARDPVDGSELWRAEASGTDGRVPAVVSGGVVTAGDSLVAREAADGSEAWSTEISGSAVSWPVPHDGVVHLTSSRRLIYAVRGIDGERAWTHASRGMPSVPMAVSDEAAFVLDDDGYLYRVDAGDRAWRVQLDSPTEVPPVVDGGTVYVTTAGGDVLALDASDGSERWRAEVPGSADLPPCVSDGTCLAADSAGRIVSVDVATGEPTWFVDVEGRVLTPPVVIGDACVVGTSEGDLVGFVAESGERAWSVSPLDEAIVGVCGGLDRVHVTGEDGGVAGAYVPDALESRRAIRELEAAIASAAERDLPTDAARARLDVAADALGSREYGRAREEALAGIAAIDEAVGTVEDLETRIGELRTEATDLASDAPVDVSPVLDSLDRAESALADGSVDAAADRVDAAAERFDEIAGEYREAADAIDGLEAAIADAREADVAVGDAEADLETARAALSDGDVDRARTVARDATARLEERVETAATARDRIDELSAAIDDAEADGIRVDEGRAALEAAEAAASDGEYAAAVSRAEAGVETVDDTVRTAGEAADRIDACEGFDPVQPGAAELAERLGSEELLAAARAAHEEGDYGRSLSLASEARATQRRARWIVDGTIGTAAVGGGLLYRYGSLDRPAAFVNEHTGFGRTEGAGETGGAGEDDGAGESE